MTSHGLHSDMAATTTPTEEHSTSVASRAIGINQEGPPSPPIASKLTKLPTVPEYDTDPKQLATNIAERKAISSQESLSPPGVDIDISVAIPWGFTWLIDGERIRHINTCALDATLMGLHYLFMYDEDMYTDINSDKKLETILWYVKRKLYDNARYQWIKYASELGRGSLYQVRRPCRDDDVDEVRDCYGGLQAQIDPAKIFQFNYYEIFGACSVGFMCSNEELYEDDSQWALREQRNTAIQVYADDMHAMQARHFDKIQDS